MRQIKSKPIHNTALLFLLFAPFAIVYYGVYVFNPQNAGNIILYILQVCADTIAILVVGTLWLTILLDLIQPEYHKREFHYNSTWFKTKRPTVDVLIPVYNEPLEIIKETLTCALNLDYPHQVYCLDDGASLEIEQFCYQSKINYLSRPKHSKNYAKAGNLNYGLQNCHGDYFAVFDADHVPKKTFLTELLPFFEDEKIALVQTPQYYKNTNNFIASGTAQAQEVFYSFLMPAKNSYNSAFCVGTNMIYKRSAIDEVGGITLIDHSEDIWTTLKLHEKGYGSIFYNKVLAIGRAPESISSFFRQQKRWAMGGFSMFFSRNPLTSEYLSADQKLQYFFTNIYYFSAFAILIYLILPIIYLLFGIHPMNLEKSDGWLIHYLPFFITVYFLPIFLIGNLKLSNISTSIASFYPHLKAFFTNFLQSNYVWVATETLPKNLDLMFFEIWPHVFLIVLSLLSVLVGWYDVNHFNVTLVMTFWVLLNAYFLFLFIQNGSKKLSQDYE